MKKLVCLFIASLLHISMALASTFHLSVEVTPDVAGTLNNDGGDYEENSSIYLSTSRRTGYVFLGWYEDDALLSTSTGFYYTMPARDALVQARYEYNPSVPDNPMPDTATYYTLTTSLSPTGAGSINHEKGQYTAGYQVYLSASKNTGFQFEGWKNEQDEVVSTSSSFYYTMPSRDTHLTATYTYNPSTPANPDTVVPEYQVTVTAEPTYAGSFNTSSTMVEKGGSVYLYAYTNTGFVFKYWKNPAGDTLSTDQNFSYSVPEHDSQVIGVFEYDPTLPSNPNKNYWNPQTGEVIADEFTAGSLYSAISEAIKGSDRSEVSMITVAGRINSNDFGIANNFTNCTLFDFSRVTGVTTIPSYAFDGTNIETIYLPSTIETIGYRAFEGCANLSSITCYATTPPAVESYVFKDVPAGLVVYVPSSVIPQYQEAEVWKDFTILPIQDDIRSITVCLPEGTSTTDYKQMWLELINVKSGQRIHYIMTERSVYTFYNLIHHTTWNIQLRNEAGDVFGAIENVEVADNDTTVTFASLQKPQTVALSVLEPNGTDVTNQVVITWTDEKGVYVAKSPHLNMQKEGKKLNYQIQLPQELATQYALPQTTEYIVEANNNIVKHTLQPLTSTTVTGKVVDAKTQQAIEKASVVASLTFANQYTQTISAQTNKQGEYQLSIPKVPTTLTFEAAEYISQTINCDSLVLASKDMLHIDDIRLKTITGVVLSLKFTYTSSVVEGETAETQNWYADYNNVQYTLYNITKQRAITQFNVQYPQIVLLEEVEDKDELLITATSKNNSFIPVESHVVVTEQTANATFNIYELGKIQATFAQSENNQSVGLLYDANGELIKSYAYNSAQQLTTDKLSDATYTLVSMGYHQLLNAIYSIGQLSQIGLVEGVDYTKNTIQVQSGKIAAISISTIPTLDDSKLNYTDENTSFTVNKPSIVAGNYLTLTGKISFKPEFANEVSNVQLIVELPQSCSFVENSVMVGNATSNYVLQGNRLTIPVQRHTDRVRFCVIPTRGGQYAPSASVQFDLGQETIVQPIGAANYEVKDLSIKVPSVVAKTSVPVKGTAIGRSKVEIFGNDTKIGETTALANGVWSITCELHEPYNLSTHSIYAKVTTPQGLDLQSETMECMYDINAVQVSKVTMYHPNPELNKTFESVFDFLNPSSTPNKWTVYYPKKVFTYTIEFTNNSPEVVSNVILYVHTADGKYLPYEASYNLDKDLWCVECDLGTKNDGCYPVNVSVDFDAITESFIDYDHVQEVYKRDSLRSEFDVIDNAYSVYIDALEKLYSNEFDIAEYQSLLENYSNLIDVDADEDSLLIEYFSSFSHEQLVAFADSLAKDSTLSQLAILEYYDAKKDLETLQEFNMLIDGINISSVKSDCKNITRDSLITEGFISIPMSNGDTLYIKGTEDSFEVVDFSSNQYFKHYSTTNDMLYIRNRSASDMYTEALNMLHSINNKLVNYQEDLLEFMTEFATYANEKMNASLSNAKMYRSMAIVDREMGLTEGSGELLETAKDFEKEAARLEQNAAKWQKFTAKTTKVAGELLGGIVELLTSTSQLIQDLEKWRALDNEINNKIPCIGNEEYAESLAWWVRYYGRCICTGDVLALSGAAVSFGVTLASLWGIPMTGGLSSIAGVGGVLCCIGSIAVGVYFDYVSDKHYQRLNTQVKQLKCNDDDGDGDDNNDGGEHESGSEDDEVQIDPSGYVYEGVSSNRLEGVTATCYYKETVEDMYGDLHENIVKWNAEEYAQENPLFTDENGMYRWDVPQGLWQVKFEKEGYETTYSEWLPVPPPQLEVNIAMKQNVQPNVQSVHAYEDAIEIQFDKYMLPELLTTDNIIVMADTTIISGSIEMLDKELCYEGLTEEYVSKVRFNAVDTFATEEVTLLVKNRVKSYAGIRMQDDFSQMFTTEQELKSIVCDSIINVIYGGQKTIYVQAQPAVAAAGKTLQVVSSSPMLLKADTTAVLDANGQAAITLYGELPGSASIRLSIEDTDITTTSMVKIVNLVAASVIDSVICAGESITWCGNSYDSTGIYVDTLGTTVVTLNLTVLPEAITQQHDMVLCQSELPYEWYGQMLKESGNYTASEQFAAAQCDSVVHELTLSTYVQTIPATVTEPVVYIGQAIDVAPATADIQAHIDAQPLYAPEAMIEWYIFNEPNWEPLTTAPFETNVPQVLLKYAVETSCGVVESDTLYINTIMSNLENITHDIVDVQKIIHNGQVLILRNGNIYTTIGIQLQ